MIRRWLALTYYLYALRLAALSHFYFNPLYRSTCTQTVQKPLQIIGQSSLQHQFLSGERMV